MRATPSFISATEADAAELAADMRPDDAVELRLWAGLTPADGAALAVRVSSVCFAARCGGRLFALFGGRPDTELGDTGCIWALGAREIDRDPRTFVRWSRFGLELVRAAEPDVERWRNWCLCGNARTERWLSMLGARFEQGSAESFFGGAFRRFEIGG